jgi:hypothetical protein
MEKQGKTAIEIVAGQMPSPMLFELTPKPASAPKISPRGAQPSVAHGRVLDSLGQPLAGADVTSYYYPEKGIDAFPQQYGHAFTSNDGTYALPILPYGTAHIIAGGDSTSSAESKTFPTTPGGQVQVEDLAVRPANATVSGEVVDENGKPLANVQVKGYSKNKHSMNAGIRTDLEGKFTLTHVLEDETIQINARGPDYSEGDAYAAPNSSDAIVVLHPNKLLPEHFPQPQPLPDLIGKMAPDWTVDTWLQAPAGQPSPKRNDDRWTLFVIIGNTNDATASELTKIKDAADTLHAQPVIIFTNRFEHSLVKGLLANEGFSGLEVGIDKYLYEDNMLFADSATHMAYRGGYFLIDPAGIVRGMERYKPISVAESEFAAIIGKN